MTGIGSACVITAVVLAVARNAPDKTPASANRDHARANRNASHALHRSNSEKIVRSRTSGSLVEAIKTARLKMPVVHVGGQVVRIGSVRRVPDMTLMQAIEGAGGATEFGQLSRVEVIHSGSGKVRTYNLRDPELKALPLGDGDTITVPECTFFGR